MRIVFVFFILAANGQQTGPAAIMARVASNMESASEARRQFVYRQKVKARLLRTNGQVARQEEHAYSAIPAEERTNKELISFAGEYHKSKKEIIKYDKPGFEKGGMDFDGGIIQDLVKNLVNHKKSRDGIPHSLFPLESKDLDQYKFKLLETTTHQGRRAYRIGFEPAGKAGVPVNMRGGDDCPQKPWKGEALIDDEDMQPIRIATDSAFKMPWGVKVFLGTNLRQTGFSVTYTRVAPGVWFPATYGTEFKLDLLFGYHRVITMAMDSSDFRRTTADTKITFAQ